MHVNHKSRLALAAVAALGLAAAPSFAAQINTIASFNGASGQYPVDYDGLTFDSLGNLYGTTSFGGAGNFGTVFEVVNGSNTITNLASFNGTNGAYPASPVILDSLGNLYGTTNSAGAKGVGTVFEIVKGSGKITDLAFFNNTNGAYPTAGLTFDSLGNLYGTAQVGGIGNNGTVFEVVKGSNTITDLAFFNGTNGSDPGAGVTFDSLGNLYGTTQVGGASGYGTVFELVKGSSAITALASFNGTNGSDPASGVTFDSQGNLYGTTKSGGINSDGAVFELAKGSSAITALASFNGANGSTPYGGVSFDSLGNLYGTTSKGGAGNFGTVFELAKGSSAITDLASFNNTNGKSPQAGVTFDSQGNLYGTTNGGGANFNGTVFEVNNPNPAVVLTPESSGLANTGGALLALALGGLVSVVKKRKSRTP